MNQSFLKKTFFYFFLYAFLLIATSPAFAQRTRALMVGEEFPNILIEEKLSSSDLKYLGLSKKAKFRFNEIKAELILLEVLNVYCPSCQKQAPIFNHLYGAIENNPSTKGKIKMLGIAAGNNQIEAQSFRKRFNISYPIISDLKFKILDVVGSTRAPFHIAIRKSPEEMVVARAHLGRIEDYAGYYKDVSTIMTYKIAMIKQTKKKGTPEPLKPLKTDISEEKLIMLVKQGLKEVGNEIIEFKEIKLKNNEIVYMGKMSKKNEGEKLFAKVASREAICDICENIHFIFVFDSKGKVVNLVPVVLTKYGNIKWNVEDLKKMKSRILGKYLYNPFDFDSRVDAVSQATMTSVLIFDSLERADTIYQELRERGYLN